MLRTHNNVMYLGFNDSFLLLFLVIQIKGLGT